MTLPDGYRFRALTEDDRRLVVELDTWAFPTATETDDILGVPSPLSWDRTSGIEADGFEGLAAMHASYPFTGFQVPGGTLPTAGLTWVGVHPQHRRRGLLSAMIDQHLTDCVDRGEPLSALFAAEAAIYGRFGYGRAADDLRLQIPRGAELRHVPGAERHTVRVEAASRDRHGALVDALHRAAGAAPTGVPGINRPGWAERETEALQAAYWSDPAMFRGGREPRRIAVVELDGEPRGYATFRRKDSWEDAGPRGTVSIGEAVALDGAAARALWGVLVDLDLMAEVTTLFLPVDDPVLQLLVDQRAAVPRTPDNVWVRIVDVPAALAGRTYAADVDVTIAVTDLRLSGNAGTWRLRASAWAPATVERSFEDPAISLDVRELGAAYLGGVTLASLAAAGLVAEHTPGALARASAAFAWPVKPVCSWVF